MRVIPLASTPNQAFTVTLDLVRWGFRLITLDGAMACDVDREGVRLLSGVRLCAGEPIIPYRRLQDGNFLFLTVGDHLPKSDLFGQSQTLVYLNAAEIAELPPFTQGEAAELGQSIQYLFTDDGLYITTDAGELIEDA